MDEPVDGAMSSLLILTAVALINYIDRYSPSALKEQIIDDLDLTDFESSIPSTFFLFIYIVSNVAFSHLSDRGFSRPKLLALGVLLWSIPVSLTFFSQNFASYFFFRGLVGVGEGAYSVIAPTLISDLFPPSQRNRYLAFYTASIPVGAAMGFIFGGLLGQFFNWRIAFLVLGLAGLPFAWLCLRIRDPGQGYFEPNAVRQKNSFWDGLKILSKSKIYLYVTGGMILATFCVGGLAEWGPAFFRRRFGVSEALSSLVPGIAVVIGGIGGTLLGSSTADQLRIRNFRNPYFAVPATGQYLGVIVLFLGLYLVNFWLNAFFIVLTQLFIWTSNGPNAALTANHVDPFVRGQAFGTQIFAIHALGDGLSPWVIGALSDRFSIEIALLCAPLSLLGAAVVWTVAWFTVDEGHGVEVRELQLQEDVSNEIGLIPLDED